MDKLKEIEWLKHGFKVAVVGLFSVCGLLYAQQNDIIAKQGVLLDKSCTELNRKIDNKVDNQVLREMIKTITVKIDNDSERWEEQQEINKNTSENLQELNINMILIREKFENK